MAGRPIVQIKMELDTPAIPTKGPLKKAWMIREAMEIYQEEEHRFDGVVGVRLTNLWPGMMR